VFDYLRRHIPSLRVFPHSLTGSGGSRGWLETGDPHRVVFVLDGLTAVELVLIHNFCRWIDRTC
jgi:hypothetical protein